MLCFGRRSASRVYHLAHLFITVEMKECAGVACFPIRDDNHRSTTAMWLCRAFSGNLFHDGETPLTMRQKHTSQFQLKIKSVADPSEEKRQFNYKDTKINKNAFVTPNNKSCINKGCHLENRGFFQYVISRKQRANQRKNYGAMFFN